MKTPLSNHGSHANRRTTVSYFLKHLSAFESESSDQILPERAISRFMEKLSPLIIAHEHDALHCILANSIVQECCTVACFLAPSFDNYLL